MSKRFSKTIWFSNRCSAKRLLVSRGMCSLSHGDHGTLATMLNHLLNKTIHALSCSYESFWSHHGCELKFTKNRQFQTVCSKWNCKTNCSALSALFRTYFRKFLELWDQSSNFWFRFLHRVSWNEDCFSWPNSDTLVLLKSAVFGVFFLFVLSLLKSALLSTTLWAICEPDKVLFFDLLDALGVMLMEL